MIHVKTKIDRADKDLIAELGTFSAAHDSRGTGDVRGSLHPAIKPIDRDMKFCGSAFTVKCHPPRQPHAAGCDSATHSRGDVPDRLFR